MLSYCELGHKRKALRDWNDGYRIGKSYVYNPFSLSNAVDALTYDEDAVCRNYWLDTGGTALVKEMLYSCKSNPELKTLFDRLLDGEGVEAGYTTAVVFCNILESNEIILGALLLSGYLTVR